MKPRIAFFTVGTSDHPPSSRIRGHGIAETLRENGYDVEVFPGIFPWEDYPDHLPGKIWLLLRRFLHRISDVAAARKYDCIYVQKAVFPYNIPFPVFPWLLKKLGKPVIFDFDDAIWVGNEKKINRFIRLADAVVVAGEYLHDYAVQHNENTVTIPMSVDADLFKPYPSEESRFTLGYLGAGESSVPYLRLLVEPLKQFAATHEDIVFKIVGAMNCQDIYDMFDDLPCETVFVDRVPPDKVPEAIKDFDVGLTPLTADDFSLGKCPIKILEYMSCGLPVICSDVGENKNLVEEGKDGFLVDSAAEWVDAFSQLYTNPEKRERMGEAARKKIVEHYTYQANAEKVAALVEDVCNRYS